MYVFRNGASSSTKQGSVFFCGHYVCCTEVSTREYPRCHGVQVTMDSVHPLLLHYTCYCCVFTVPLPSNGCFSGSTILALSKYAKIFCNSHEWSQLYWTAESQIGIMEELSSHWLCYRASYILFIRPAAGKCMPL
jgi:hypothetical protein